MFPKKITFGQAESYSMWYFQRVSTLQMCCERPRYMHIVQGKLDCSRRTVPSNSLGSLRQKTLKAGQFYLQFKLEMKSAYRRLYRGTYTL